MRQLLQLKNRELATLKQHATTVLEQRSEVEQFFLEALDQCKAKVKRLYSFFLASLFE